MRGIRRLLSLAAALLCGAGLLAVPAAAQAPALTLVRVACVPADDVTPILYAIRNGMFRKAGLDVQYQPVSNGAATMAALLAGGIEIGHTNIVSLLQAHFHGIPISLVAPGEVYDARAPYNDLMVRADSPYRTAADLNGKIVAGPSLSDLFTLSISAWVDKNGGDSKTLKFVELPMAAGGPALDQHRVDAAIMLYPAAGTALAEGKARVLGHAFSAFGEYFMAVGFVATDDWAGKHPEVVRAFEEVLVKAIGYTNTHHTETAPIESELTGIPLATVLKIPRGDSATSLDPALMQPIVDAAAKYNFIPRAIPARELIFSGLVAPNRAGVFPVPTNR